VRYAHSTIEESQNRQPDHNPIRADMYRRLGRTAGP
jgi:hypothetical protein